MSTIKIKNIQRIVADYYDFNPSYMINKTRYTEHVKIRRVAMYLARQLTGHTYPHIARLFGNRDHTTPMNAYKKIQKKRLADPGLDSDINQLTKIITGEKEEKEQDQIQRLQRKIEQLESLITEIHQELKHINDAIPDIKKFNVICSRLGRL